MSEQEIAEAPVEQGVAEIAEGMQAPVPEKAGASMMQDQGKKDSPFDVLFQEGAIDNLPSNLKNWIGMQKDGQGFEKGLAYLQKTASGKELAPLGEDATDDEREARQKAIRDAKGVPEKPEDYEFSFPEGMEMPEENQALLKQYAHEHGHTAEEVNSMMEFQLGIEARTKEAEIKNITESAYKLFEDDGVDFDAVAPEIKSFIEKQGYNFNNVKKSAESIHMAYRLQQLLGETAHVDGSKVMTGPGNPNDKRYAELLAGETMDSKIFLQRENNPRRMFQLQEEFHELARKRNG